MISNREESLLCSQDKIILIGARNERKSKTSLSLANSSISSKYPRGVIYPLSHLPVRPAQEKLTMRCPGGQTTQTGSFQCTVSSTLYRSQMTKLLSHPSEEGHFSCLYPQSVFQGDSRFTRTSTFKFISHFITDLYRVHMTGNARPLYLLTSHSKVRPNGTRLKYKTGENIFPPHTKTTMSARAKTNQCQIG